MSSIEIKEIAHGSALYQEMVNLRYNLLRKPLGLEFTEEQLKEEINDTHLATLLQGKIVACLILSPYSPDKVKLRQMAVHSECQGKGIGHLLLKAAENIARKREWQMISWRLHLESCCIDKVRNCLIMLCLIGGLSCHYQKNF